MTSKAKQKQVKIASAVFGNTSPLALIGGMNVLESRGLAFQVAEVFTTETSKLKIPFVFKASFDKANRSSLTSFRGPGLEEGLRLLQELKDSFKFPVLTDVHEPGQVAPVAEVCDCLQLPAFLARQTDLVTALAKSNKPVNIKKPQFISHSEMSSVVEKFTAAGNDQLLLCERGNSFGYNNLVVDMLGFAILKDTGYPVVFDVTHSLQLPGGGKNTAGGTAAAGRGASTLSLARAGVSQGIAALFIEAHPDPSKAKCDGPCALPLAEVPKLLQQAQKLDQLVSSFA